MARAETVKTQLREVYTHGTGFTSFRAVYQYVAVTLGVKAGKATISKWDREVRQELEVDQLLGITAPVTRNKTLRQSRAPLAARKTGMMEVVKSLVTRVRHIKQQAASYASQPDSSKDEIKLAILLERVEHDLEAIQELLSV